MAVLAPRASATGEDGAWRFVGRVRVVASLQSSRSVCVSAVCRVLFAGCAVRVAGLCGVVRSRPCVRPKRPSPRTVLSQRTACDRCRACSERGSASSRSSVRRSSSLASVSTLFPRANEATARQAAGRRRKDTPGSKQRRRRETATLTAERTDAKGAAFPRCFALPLVCANGRC